MPNDPRPTKAQRQADARAKAAELRRQQEAAAKRNRFLAIGGAILAVLVIVGAVVFVLVQNRQNEAAYGSAVFGGGEGNVVAPALAEVQAPSTADDTGGIPVSDEGVGVAGSGDTVLSVYFDPQCPACASFDAINAADLKALASEPDITVVYQPLTFLDYYSRGTNYSSRAGNAMMVVADQDPEHFEDFLTAMFQNQPDENTPGLSDDKIGEIAAGVGVPQAVIDQFTATVDGTFQTASEDGTLTDHPGTWRTFAPFLAAATQHADDQFDGLSTPTVMVDGEVVSGRDAQVVNVGMPGALAAYVREAAAS